LWCPVLSPANDKNKRERLQVSQTVLKLATKLLKELESPNRVSGKCTPTHLAANSGLEASYLLLPRAGFALNPYIYNITRVVLVSALSAAMSDVLGFNIKMWKLLKI
jgi:hypothetical protein